MSITTDNLAEFVDRLADLKRALAQLNDAGTADRHLIGLETVANAARALFDDDKQTTALRLFANPRSVDCLALVQLACGTLCQSLAVWFVQGWYPFASIVAHSSSAVCLQIQTR